MRRFKFFFVSFDGIITVTGAITIIFIVILLLQFAFALYDFEAIVREECR